MTASRDDFAERRRYPRLKVKCSFNPSTIFGEKGQIFNVSLGGMRVYSDKWYMVGKNLEIEVFFPNERSLKATVKVVWIKNLPPDSAAKHDLGVEFITLPFEGIDELQRVLEHAPLSD